MTPLLPRVAARIVRTEGCWSWAGSHQTDGYAKTKIAGRTAMVHRLVYEAFVGPIPAGHHIDHLCRNPGCVNPSHLEPVTPRENTMRGTNHVAAFAVATHCKHGHPFSGHNLLIRRAGGRKCRECNKRQCRERRERLAVRESRS